MSPLRETLAAKFCRLIAVICVVAIVPGDTLAELPSSHAQAPSASAKAQAPPTKIPPDQLDSLVAPLALYPDPLLAQTLAASTYPLEIIQLHQWLEKHTTLKDKALAAESLTLAAKTAEPRAPNDTAKQRIAALRQAL